MPAIFLDINTIPFITNIDELFTHSASRNIADFVKDINVYSEL